MKKVFFTSTIILFLVVGCGGNKQTFDNLITVDVTKRYPNKELILQNFTDVEYIALETTDEFLTQGQVLAIGKEILIVKNLNSDGDIFIFDRKGNGLRKFNRKGQGPEEYTSVPLMVILDEENNEMLLESRGKIMVYDLYGKFLRSFPASEGAFYIELYNLGREHLVFRNLAVRTNEQSTESSPFTIISKKDGRFVNDIRIRFDRGINPTVVAEGGMMILFLSSMYNEVISYRNNWILTELSSDTIFRLLPDFSMTPFIARTPSVHSTSPEICLIPIVLTDRYYFMETFKKEMDKTGFLPRTKLAYDRQEKEIYQYTIYNDDFTTKKTVDFSVLRICTNDEIAYWQKLEAYELIESNEKGELKGKLKEIATKLDTDDNPVIMIVKHKK